MAHDLSSGSRLIRSLQVAALLIAGAGGGCAVLMLSAPTVQSVARYAPWTLAAFFLDAVLLVVVMRMLATAGCSTAGRDTGGRFR